MGDTWETEALWRTIERIVVIEREDGSEYRMQFVLSDLRRPDVLQVTSDSPLKIEMKGFEDFLSEAGWTMAGHSAVVQHDQEAVRKLFHDLWTASLSSANYRKDDWLRLRSVLSRFG